MTEKETGILYKRISVIAQVLGLKSRRASKLNVVSELQFDC
jgi:hypothetical protein